MALVGEEPRGRASCRGGQFWITPGSRGTGSTASFWRAYRTTRLTGQNQLPWGLAKWAGFPFGTKRQGGSADSRGAKQRTEGSCKWSPCGEQWTVQVAWKGRKSLQKAEGAWQFYFRACIKQHLIWCLGAVSMKKDERFHTLCEEVNSSTIASHVEIFRQTLTCGAMW